MKIEPYVRFSFEFGDCGSKLKAYHRLQKFLHDHDWLPEDSDADPRLLDYHTNADTTSEVILKKVEGISLEDLSILFYDDLVKEKDISFIKVNNTQDTSFLICKYADMYRQSKHLSLIEEDDDVCIYRQ